MLVLAPILWLGIVMLAAAFYGVVETSISAYHGGQFRDVFVAALAGISISLLAFWGVTPLEDLLLNLAAFFAVFVAIIPFDMAQQLTHADLGVPLDPRLVAKLIIIGYLATIGALIAADYTKGRWSAGWVVKPAPDQPQVKPLGRVIGIASIASLVAYLLLTLGCLLDPSTTFPFMHMTAAVLVFAHLAASVASRAWNLYPTPDTLTDTQQATYKVIFWLMAICAIAFTLVAIVLRVTGSSAGGLELAIELTEIALFAAYWTSEIIRYWPTANDTT